MRSKKKAAPLSPRIPKLRFPEFQDAPEWEMKKLSCVCEVNPPVESLPDTFIYIDLESVEAGTLSKKNIIAKKGAPSRAQRLLQDRDIIYQTVRPYQKNNLHFFRDDRMDYVASTGYAQLRAHDSSGFLYQYIHVEKFVNCVLANCTGSNYPAINSSDLAEIYVDIPKLPEQQRIADCLSSLDELIEAEAKRLDALKDHKKGLMQQLFPAEGETTPKLRFPEFQDAPEWEEKKIQEFAKVKTGSKDTQNKVEDGDYPFFVRSQTVERINSYSHDGEAILTSGDGVGVGKNFHYIVGKFDFHQRVYCIYDFANTISGFFIYLFFTEHFRQRVMQMSAKNSVDSVRMAMITEMPISLPSLPEQQRIADCLSSLDELIAAQTKKLDALKDHKKGLMQQLFPSSEEGNA